MIRRNVHVFFALLFLVAALVQWNDPDWLPWVAIYAAAALESTMAAFGRHERARSLVIALVALAWSLKLSASALEGSWVWNEVQRETGGVLLVALVMLLAWRSPGAAERL